MWFFRIIFMNIINIKLWFVFRKYIGIYIYNVSQIDKNDQNSKNCFNFTSLHSQCIDNTNTIERSEEEIREKEKVKDKEKPRYQIVVPNKFDTRSIEIKDNQIKWELTLNWRHGVRIFFSVQHHTKSQHRYCSSILIY